MVETERKRPAITVNEMVLLHLCDFSRFSQDHTAPQEVTQGGISATLGIRSGHISRALVGLQKSDLIEERQSRVKGSQRRLKVYFPTILGQESAKEIKVRLRPCRVPVADGDVSRDMTLEAVEASCEGILRWGPLTFMIRSSGRVNLALLGGRAAITKEDAGLEAGPDAGPGIEPEAGPEDAPACAGVSRPHSSEFLGRAEELARLEGMVLAAGEGGGATVFISGAAGIGKTRLAEELAAMARDAGFVVLYGHCLPEKSAEPFFAIKDAFRRCVVYPSAAVGPKGRKGAARSLDPQAGPDGYMDTLLAFAAESPTLVMLDDLHWADSSTMGLLHHLATFSKDLPLIIAGTFRPEEARGATAPSPLEETLRAMGRERLFFSIELAPLSEEEMIRLSRSFLDTEHLPEGLSALLFKVSEGNPLIAQEALRMMLAEDVLTLSGDTFALRDGGVEDSVPGVVKDIVLRRVSLLDDDSRMTLEAAAALGETFREEALLAILDIEAVRAFGALDRLVGVDFLEESHSDGAGCFRFTHNMVRAVVYGSLGRRKRSIHERIARMLEDRHGATDALPLFDIAHHYSHSWNHEKAIFYNLKAAELAILDDAKVEAMSFLESSLTSLERLEGSGALWTAPADAFGSFSGLSGPGLKLELFSRLVKLGDSIGEFEKTRRYCSLLLESPDNGDVSKEMELMPLLCHCCEQLGDDIGLKDSYSRYLKLAEAAGDLEELAIVYTRCATSFRRNPDRARLELLAGEKAGSLVDTLIMAGAFFATAISHGKERWEEIIRIVTGLLEKAGVEGRADDAAEFKVYLGIASYFTKSAGEVLAIYADAAGRRDSAGDCAGYRAAIHRIIMSRHPSG